MNYSSGLIVLYRTPLPLLARFFFFFFFVSQNFINWSVSEPIKSSYLIVIDKHFGPRDVTV